MCGPTETPAGGYNWKRLGSKFFRRSHVYSFDNIFSRYADSFKIFFEASSQACSATFRLYGCSGPNRNWN